MTVLPWPGIKAWTIPKAAAIDIAATRLNGSTPAATSFSSADTPPWSHPWMSPSRGMAHNHLGSSRSCCHTFVAGAIDRLGLRSLQARERRDHGKLDENTHIARKRAKARLRSLFQRLKATGHFHPLISDARLSDLLPDRSNDLAMHF